MNGITSRIALLLLLAVVSNAQAAMLAAGNGNGAPGTTVVIPLLLQDFSDPVSTLDVQLTVAFDDTSLSLVAINPGAAADGPPNAVFYSPQDLGGGQPRGILLSALFPALVTIDPEILLLEFAIAPEAAPGTYAITLADVELGDAGIAALNGSLQVGGVPIPIPAAAPMLLSAGLGLLGIYRRRIPSDPVPRYRPPRA